MESSTGAFLYIDASFAKNNNNNSFEIDMDLKKINSISIIEASFFDLTPNINIRNNHLAFFRQSDGERFSITIKENYIKTGGDLISVLISLLNKSNSGIKFFSAPLSEYYPQTFAITSSESFRWDKTSSLIQKGEFLINLMKSGSEDVFSKFKYVGPMFLQYTRFVDICSVSLTQKAINKSVSNSSKSNNGLLIRIYFDNDIAPIRRTLPILVPVWFDCSDRTRPYFDIKLFDEFGDLFYVPSSVTNFDFTLIMNTKI